MPESALVAARPARRRSSNFRKAKPLSKQNLAEAAKAYASSAYADNTLRAYQGDWARFTEFCRARSVCALPAAVESIGLYLTHLAEDGLRVSTIERAFVAICKAHTAAQYPSPRKQPKLQALRRGIRRQLGVAPSQKAPLLPAELRAAVKGAKAARTKPAMALLRDRALVLLGFAGGFRRSELVALDVEDLGLTDEGLRVLIRRSKTDQEGEGRTIGIPPGGHIQTCPVRAVQAYLEALEERRVVSGALFRPLTRTGKLRRTRLTPQSVALVVKQAAVQAGVNPRDYAGHSLRAGLVTAAARAGKSIPAIMRQTGHRSVATVTKYVREVELFMENAAEGVGL